MNATSTTMQSHADRYLERFPVDLNQGDSQGVKDRRVCRH